MLSAGCIWIYKWLSTHTHYIRYINLQEHDKVLGQNKIHEEGKSVFFYVCVIARCCILPSSVNHFRCAFELWTIVRFFARGSPRVYGCVCDYSQIRNKRHHQTIVTLIKRTFLSWRREKKNR